MANRRRIAQMGHKNMHIFENHQFFYLKFRHFLLKNLHILIIISIE